MTLIIGFILMAVLLAAAEVLVPGGVLGLMAGGALVGAAWFGWEEYGAVGAILAFMAGAFTCMVAVLGMFPLARKMGWSYGFMLKSSIRGNSRYGSATAESQPQLVGKRGEALTTLAPTGIVLLDGEKCEAYSQTGLLHRGDPVEVVKQDSYRVVVRKI
ncbi:MAG: NfeD family protein [Verrucomicrobiota bacterium]